MNISSIHYGHESAQWKIYLNKFQRSRVEIHKCVMDVDDGIFLLLKTCNSTTSDTCNLASQ